MIYVIKLREKPYFGQDHKQHIIDKRLSIDPMILSSYGAIEVSFEKDQAIFKEGDLAVYYYQLVKGQVKMFSRFEDGREFIIRVFDTGESLGEPALMGEFPYPAHAAALTGASLLRLPKLQFFELLKDQPSLHFKLSQILSRRLAFKTMQMIELSHHEAEHRLLKIIDYYGNHMAAPGAIEFQCPFTRQQLADMTGLRVETVIRATKQLEEKGEIRIEKRKIVRRINTASTEVKNLKKK